MRLSEGGVWLDHSVRVGLVEEVGVVQLVVVDCLTLSFVEPLDALAVFPKSELDSVVFRDNVRAESVLLSFVPVALVAASISPCVDAKAMLFVVLVLALVHAAIIPDVHAHAFHIVILPLPFVATAIQPRVDADT